MVKNVKVVAKDTNEVLMETDMQSLEKAYQYAADMEKMGIEVEIQAPTVTETLNESLGLGIEEKVAYAQSVHDEIADHDGSCCAKETSTDTSAEQDS